MTPQFFRASASIVLVSGICLSFTTADAQTTTPTNGAAAVTPQAPDGRPDLNGTWDNGRSTFGFAPNQGGTTCVYCAQVAGRAPATPGAARPAPDRPVYKPEFVAKVKMLDEQQVKLDPALRCKPPGLPRIGPPDKIVQTRGQVVFLYDDLSGAFFRIIPTDGRKHRTDVDPSYLGDSIGWWEGDTLVVEATNFNEDTWLGDNGLFHSPNLKVSERLRRSGNTITYTATVEDPDVLTGPWTLRPRTLTLTTQELVEPAPCVEMSLDNMIDLSHHDNVR